MYDIQHDSPTPIHEQLTSQIRAHVASGALVVGAHLAEYRAFAQELLTNPQVVSRAYAELEAEGVLAKDPAGGMVVTAGAPVICRMRLQDAARERIREAVALGLASGLAEAEVVKAVERQLAAAKVRPLSPEQLSQAITKKPTHEPSHRASQGIQDLSRKNRAGLP
jgi:GntR family transcriptional regulator